MYGLYDIDCSYCGATGCYDSICEDNDDEYIVYESIDIIDDSIFDD